MGVVYIVINNLNGHSYVGQTIHTLAIRWRDHIKESRLNGRKGLLQRAIRKYGVENFTPRVIAHVDSNDDLTWLNIIEPLFIETYNTIAPFGYNLDKGGNNRNTHPVTRAKLSAKQKGISPSKETREKISAALRGRKIGPPSAEHRAKLSAANRGRVRSPQSKANMMAGRRPISDETRRRMSNSAKNRQSKTTNLVIGETSD